MTEKTFFTGFGGQGIVSLGQIWAFCAMKEGKNVTFFPFYGAEKRGGIARANVIISDTEIASPVISKADSVVAMNQDSIAAAELMAKPHGCIIINSTLITTPPARTDVKIISIPATDIARELGNDKSANMVMLGALAAVTKALTLAGTESFLKDFFSEEKQYLVPINSKAITAGKEAAYRA
ncbi:MAG: 2-oxoacid:acceptor oxidoreductase family protein [Treponema sp.]|nr:2-oxoacid:acceptor oxidoreductase family protein [Treponema sp.]